MKEEESRRREEELKRHEELVDQEQDGAGFDVAEAQKTWRKEEPISSTWQNATSSRKIAVASRTAIPVNGYVSKEEELNRRAKS